MISPQRRYVNATLFLWGVMIGSSFSVLFGIGGATAAVVITFGVWMSIARKLSKEESDEVDDLEWDQ